VRCVNGRVLVGEWERWTYGQWNERLIKHYFRTDDRGVLDQPVDRLPATPEDLALAAGAPEADADRAADAFIRQIVASLPHGRMSFCRFCLEQGGWSPRWPEPPQFFAMLWFTCLVAYGYPGGEGDFGDRIEKVLGKRDNFRTRESGCLAGLWKAFAQWTLNRHEDGDWIRVLELPPDDPQREVIGISHFLAFPNRFDRRELARVLWESGLVGFEPPIQPLLTALEARRQRFSVDFREDLDLFVKRFASGEDPRASGFWRAVRQEALDPSVDDSGARTDRGPTATLVFMSTEDGLLPVVAVGDGFRPPQGYEIRSFTDADEWPHYVVWKDGDLETPWLAAFVDGQFLGVGLRMLVHQGVLVLREQGSGQYGVATGAEIHGCGVALVHTSVVPAFIAAFGGKPMPSIVSDWNEVTGCEVRQLEESLPGLERVTHLLRTMAPPSVTPVGGIRVGIGFLFVRPFLPLVRAAGASEVQIGRVGATSLVTCGRLDDSSDWKLPASVDQPGDYVLRATWNTPLAGGGIGTRVGETQIRFVEYVVDDRYKDKPSGGFFVESCTEAERDVSKIDEVPLGISGSDPGQSADLLDGDSSARFLGPGNGEMSLVPKPGFDWLVVGARKAPELLVFIGDPAAPTPPAQRKSPRPGDRRHWRSGFQRAQQVFARDRAGAYEPIERAPVPIREALERYRHHEVPEDAPECAETNLEGRTGLFFTREEPSPRTQQAIDALAALSCRRSGLGYQQVHELFDELVGNDDPILFQQILRGWAEAGVVDVLREAVVSRFTIVARRPRLVIIKRGPAVEATVMGMLSTVRRNRILEALSQSGGAIASTVLRPGSPWQPSTFRLRGPIDAVEKLRQRAELESSEWLDWQNVDETPRALDIESALASLRRTEPATSFRRDALWNWDLLTFERGRETPSGGIHLERRIHRDFSTIYVVLDGLEPKAWTYSRSWALLVAYTLRGEAPFATDGWGLVWSQGRAPVHLPLPVGRLCALIGDGLPGPASGPSPGILRHVYPFGRRLTALVERVLPSNWSVHPSRRANAGSDR
jgi:hypothetical protein